MKNIFILLVWGFAGMLGCQALILFAYAIGINLPVYIAIYPITYFFLSLFVNSKLSNNYFLNSTILCVIPFVYWYVLILFGGNFDIDNFSFSSSQGMIIILPLTLFFSLLAGILIVHSRRNNSEII